LHLHWRRYYAKIEIGPLDDVHVVAPKWSRAVSRVKPSHFAIPRLALPASMALGPGVARAGMDAYTDPLILTLTLGLALIGAASAWHYQRLNARLRREIRERESTEELLRESERRFRTLVETSPDGVIMTDRAGMVRYVSLQVLKLFGCSSQDELIGRHALDFVAPEYRKTARRHFFQILREGKSGALEIKALRRPKSQFWMEINGERMLDDQGAVAGVFFISRDISERKKLEANLESLANTDTLTCLPNRRCFLRDLQSEIIRCKRYGNDMALMELDLDHFKLVNDRHGHAAGDETLRLFSGLIRKRLRHNDFASRYGGEEFMIALPETHAAEARLVAERIRHDLENQAIHADDHDFRVTVSIGLAEYCPDDTPESLIKRADDALYRAKESGRNRVEV
jgi:diguanylate cyclase (GGDEF)-like protein/PAS domain S-box-containing protein